MNPVAPSLQDLDGLRAIVGAAAVLTDPDQTRGYEEAARYGGGRCAAVIRPENTSEVSQVLRLCKERGLKIIPQSGNTGLVLGSTPDASATELVLSLDRMRRILEISPANRTAEVQAGVRLSQLNGQLEPHGLCLPIDLGADPMIGGMAATNTGGARFLRYGDARRQILGLEVVLADGEILKLGGALRKDNTRLSLKDLMIGSCGALAVITGVTVLVHPIPRQTAAAILVLESADRALDVLLHCEREAGDFLSAFEAMSGKAIQAALDLKTVKDPFGGQSPEYALLIELAASTPATIISLDDVIVELLAPLLEGNAPLLKDALVGPPAELWTLRHSLSEGLKAKGQVIGFDLAFRRDLVCAFRAAATKALSIQHPDVTVCDFGHLADGGVHFNLLAPRYLPETSLGAIRALVLDLAIKEFGGSFSGEHGVGRINGDAYQRYVPAAEQRRISAIADTFSPDSLSPYGIIRRSGSTSSSKI
jgi:FAD/FMN-containing dehydrogenase